MHNMFPTVKSQNFLNVTIVRRSVVNKDIKPQNFEKKNSVLIGTSTIKLV